MERLPVILWLLSCCMTSPFDSALPDSGMILRDESWKGALDKVVMNDRALFIWSLELTCPQEEGEVI